MTKEGYLDKIVTKLNNNIQLDDLEIGTIISALRKYTEYPQEPYYEVIYHDKYDNKETRIMNPVHSTISRYPSGELIREDHFDLRFRRFIKEEAEDEKR